MASYYLIGGFVTGSQVSEKLQLFWDTYVVPSGSTGGGYLGCPAPTTPSIYFTWNAGAIGGAVNSFYTPGTQVGIARGKLFWVTPQSFNVLKNNLTSQFTQFETEFMDLDIPTENGSYRIVTPGTTLGDQFQSSNNTDGIITQYHFSSENDLWENGWKIQRGVPFASSALSTFNTWKSFQVAAAGWGINLGVAGNRAIAVATLLGYTIKSKGVQDSLGLSSNDMIRGAIVLAGAGTPFDDTNYRNLVPMLTT
jgi:hypothetical protein